VFEKIKTWVLEGDRTDGYRGSLSRAGRDENAAALTGKIET
jgi:hypothetical protein